MLALALAAACQTLPPLAPDATVALGPTPDALLRGLFGEPAAHEVAEARLLALPPELRVSLARWGLRSGDSDVALAAAAIADPAWLDLAERTRLVEIAVARSLLLPTPFSFETFRDALGHADVGRLLLSCPPVPREVYQLVGAVHRGIKAAHIPALCQLVRCDDLLLREDALRFLVLATWYTDAYRVPVADVVLAWPEVGAPVGVDPTEEKVPFVPRRTKLPADRGGWPPLLQAVLERLFVRRVEGELAGFGAWALRWADAQAPGESDQELLLLLARSDDVRARALAARHLAAASGDAATTALQAMAGAAEELPAAVALAALAQRGDVGARAQLAQRARQDGHAMAAYVGLDDAARADVLAVAFGSDRHMGLALLQLLGEAAHVDETGEIPLPSELAALLAPAAEAAPPLDELRLHALFDAWPEARTERLRRAYLAALTPGHLPDCHAAILEVTDAEAFAAKLDAARTHDVPAVRERAHVLLSRLGAPRLGAALLAYFEAQGELPVRLARSSSPELIAALRDRVTDSPTRVATAALATLLVCLGVDERLAEHLLSEWTDLPGDLDAQWHHLRTLARDGNAGAVVDAYLASRPLSRGRLDYLFAHPGAGAAAWLARARSERHHGLYAWATAELAMRGDPAARAELRAAQAAGVYPWFDDLPGYALLGDGDPSRIAGVLDHLESNCCLYACVASDLEDMVEWDGFAVADDAPRSRPSRARRYFAAHLAHLRPSRIEGRYIVVR